MRRNVLARPFTLLAILMMGSATMAQEPSLGRDTPPLLKTTSTFVSVPAWVRSESGASVRSLTAEQFQLLDQGVPQRVLTVRTDDLPISLVILMQTGGSAARQFPSYADLPKLLDKILGVSANEITLVTFDSRIEQIWHFPARSDGVIYALTHQHPGDDGAAVRDAVSFGVRQLQAEPGRFRRVVLLLSQDVDRGSVISPKALLEQLGIASTVVHSIVFPAPKSKTKLHNTRKRSADSVQSDDALSRALQALNRNTAAEIASVTGGDYVQFLDERSFNSGLIEVGADMQNAYTLGFQPTQDAAGFHTIKVEIAVPRSALNVIARSAYWFNPEPQDK